MNDPLKPYASYPWFEYVLALREVSARDLCLDRLAQTGVEFDREKVIREWDTWLVSVCGWIGCHPSCIEVSDVEHAVCAMDNYLGVAFLKESQERILLTE